jgi:hypothetical protein
MPSDRFLIAPMDEKSGLRTDLKPWLIADQAFSTLDNAYQFRGRIRKRFGSRFPVNTQFSSRLRVKIGTVDGAGNFGGNTPWSAPNTPIVPMALGQMFSVGTVVFTVNTVAPLVFLLRSDGLLLPAEYSNAGIFTLIADITLALQDVYFYPGLPVMGLQSFESYAVNDEPTIAFDTRFAYQYITDGWQRIENPPFTATVLADMWTGDDTQFFWTCTWSGLQPENKVLFITNFDETDPRFMRTLSNLYILEVFNPQISQFVEGPPIVIGSYLDSCRILVPFKNRLLALNTWENEERTAGVFTQVNYTNRLRYSQVGSPLATDAWRQDIPGKGNAIDAPTTEAIVTVEFIKDRLIVFFERSTWEVAYTGNQVYPFMWNKINTELGAESTFSVIPFDKVAIGVGNVGIHACNGSNVERIDEKIPQAVFNIHNVDGGVDRVYGIRDFTTEMTYWAFPSTTTSTDQPYPNKVLVFNYKTGCWAFFDDSITCFGYFQAAPGANWDSTQITWDSDTSWDATTTQSKFRDVIAGNQQGFTFICDSNCMVNASALQITDLSVLNNVVTIWAINHNLRVGDYIYFEGVTGTGNLNLLNGKIFAVNNAYPVFADQFTINYSDNLTPPTVLAGVYSGGGLMSRVSSINIATKQYNFYAQEGRNAAINKIDFMVTSTAAGEMQVQYYASTSQDNLLEQSSPSPVGNGCLLGTGNLDTYPYTATIPFEQFQDRLWHPLYIMANGECIQLYLTMSDEQMRDPDIRECDFELHAMVFYANRTSARLE